MKKNGHRMLSLALVPIVAINLYAGSKMLKKNISEEKVEPKSVTTHMVEFNNYREVSVESEVLETQEEVSETDVFSRLDKMYESAGKDFNELLSIEDKFSELYASGLYAKLKSVGLSDEVIREEIDNILAFSLTFTDMDDQTWLRLFGNMESTISEYDNVIDYYYPLAIYVHKNECELSHTAHEFDEERMTCATLEEMAENAITMLPSIDYVIEMIKASEDEQVISEYKRIEAAGLDFNAVLGELNNMYILSQTPMCIDDEVYKELFSNLLTTVGEYDNVFVVYGELANYVHALNCDYEHSVDEYGVNVCEGIKLEYK